MYRIFGRFFDRKLGPVEQHKPQIYNKTLEFNVNMHPISKLILKFCNRNIHNNIIQNTKTSIARLICVLERFKCHF